MACLPFAAFLALSLLAEAHGAAGLGAPLAAMHRDAVGLPHVQELHAALGRLCATIGVCRPPRKPLLNFGGATPAPKGGAGWVRVAVLVAIFLLFAAEFARGLRDLRTVDVADRRKKDITSPLREV